MPYKDPNVQRAYQREWQARRRADWLAENGPCVDCGSWERLEVDHVDPATKDAVLRRRHQGTAVWSWSQIRRDAELAKCLVRCHDCHYAKTLRNGEYARGEQIAQSKLTADQVREIRRLVTEGASFRDVARSFDVDQKNIRVICKGETWKHLEEPVSVSQPPC